RAASNSPTAARCPPVAAVMWMAPGKPMRKFLIPALFSLLPLAAVAQPPGWNDPFPPHRVMDNLYYVGTSQLASFLLTTPQGHILMLSNYESSVPVIRAAVEELGF